MGTLFLVTCGTSLLTNNADNPEKQRINELTNKKEEELTPDDKRVLDEILNRAKKCLSDNRPEDRRKTGAERNAIETYINNKKSSSDSADQYYLLHTDTYLGERTTELLRDFFTEKFGLSVMTHKMTKVNTSSERLFQEGCRELAKWMTDTLPEYKKKNYQIVFNLTGGFKSLQGMMQTMGTFYADETVYIFETANELIQIPRIPMDLNSELKTLFKEYHSIFRRLSANSIIETKDLSESENSFVKKQTLLFDQVDSLTSLSSLGILCWENNKDEIYCSSLLDSPSPRIRFSDRFRTEAKNHLEYFKELNERTDDFLAFLDNPDKNIKRLDFKPIKGNHPQFSHTHECDAWSASPGYRIFMHAENQTWVFDQLAPGIDH